MTQLPSVALVLPPLTQLNTPYPSTAYLARFLGQHGVQTTQRDLGIELMHSLFSRDGLEQVFDALEGAEELPLPAWRALSLREAHLRAVGPAMAFLQGRDSGLAPLILDTPLLPRGPAFERVDREAFGAMGTQDAARHLATLYLEDLVNLVRAGIDPGFEMSRYQHHLSLSAADFTPLYQRLHQTTLVDALLDALADTLTGEVVGISVPFPGNLYGALRVGRRLKERGATVILGGGYVNTELREVDERRLWEFADALTYDDGEGPLLAILEHLGGGPDRRHRTRTAEGLHQHPAPRPPFTPAGDYGDLDLSLYLQLIDTLNPAHRLWADGRWNKITLAHGCYWQRCAFCDVNLDYIKHFETTSAAALVDHIERLIEQTGQRGFHFVDEAAPPTALKALAIELLRRGTGITFWGNIRFERAYTPDLARLLAAAGMVAATGGLEVAKPRLLRAIRKGVTVEQVIGAAQALRAAGVRVHAYLMYGFPTQTDQETIDAMEVVRQLFAAELIDSAFWHRFVLTRHAPIAEDPAAFGITVEPQAGRPFASNDLSHADPTGGDHDRFDEVLPLALEAWMRGRELERPVHHWFSDMPATTEPPDLVARALRAPPREGKRLLWLGGAPLADEEGVQLHHPHGAAFIPCEEDEADWLMEVLEAAHPAEEPLELQAAIEAFPGDWAAFAERWAQVRALGAVLI
ncbi:MAG: radical SAM protein [Deltaproteobacteria bacterium]|nr:radical SAM protein [Deltaproteobacteria bacterium]